MWLDLIGKGKKKTMRLIDQRYYDNSDGMFDFMPVEHRPGGRDPNHSDWKILKNTPRAFTSFHFLNAWILEGDPYNWVNRYTLAQHKGPNPNIGDSKEFVPKPYGLRGTFQKTVIFMKDPITNNVYSGIYRCRVHKNGFAWRVGPRISDDDVGGVPKFYVTSTRRIPIIGGILTAGIKDLSKPVI